jgi:hypothetical protein
MATYIAEADVLDEGWIEAHAVLDLFQECICHVLKGGVFEAALFAFT